MPGTIGYPVERRSLRSKKWKEALVDARTKLDQGKMHRRSRREEIWERSERQYEGDHWIYSDDDTSDLVVVNMSFSTVNVIMPYMTGSDPRFLVVPYSGDATQRNAAIQQALINRIWRSRRVSGKRHIKSAAWNYCVYGDGFLKCGYDIENRRTSDSEYADVAQLWVDSVSPWDVWMDPSADGLHNARWVCQRLWLTKDELAEDERYAYTGDTNVAYGADGGERSSKDGEGEPGFSQEPTDGSEYAVVYEFYDLAKRRMIVFSEGEIPLRVVEDIGASPLVQLGNYKLPNSPWHMGELEQIWELQVELNKTRSHLITHRRRQAAKFFAKRGALNQDAVDALQSPVVNDVAFVDGDQPLDQLVASVTLPNLSADVYNVSEIMQNDIYEITGINEYLRGSGPEIRRTATEASIVESASNIKTQFKLQQIEDALREVGALMLGFAKDVFPQTEFEELQLFLTGREAEAVQRADFGEQMMQAQADGADPMMMAQLAQQAATPMDVSVSPTPDIFVGDYEVDVESHSTELRNPVLKEQKAREMAMGVLEMAPLLNQLGVMINYKRLLEEWFEKAGVEDVDGLLEGATAGMPPPGMGAPPAPEGAGGPELLPGAPPSALQDPAMMGMLGSQNTGAFPAA